MFELIMTHFLFQISHLSTSHTPLNPPHHLYFKLPFVWSCHSLGCGILHPWWRQGGGRRGGAPGSAVRQRGGCRHNQLEIPHTHSRGLRLRNLSNPHRKYGTPGMPARSLAGTCSWNTDPLLSTMNAFSVEEFKIQNILTVNVCLLNHHTVSVRCSLRTIGTRRYKRCECTLTFTCLTDKVSWMSWLLLL